MLFIKQANEHHPTKNLRLKYLFQKLLFKTPLSIKIKDSTGSQFSTSDSISNQQRHSSTRFTQHVIHQEQRKALKKKDSKETLDNSKHIWQREATQIFC